MDPRAGNSGGGGKRRWFRPPGAALAAAILLRGPWAWTQEAGTAPEHEIKAGFVYKFVLFTNWPDSRKPPDGAGFVIGVLGTGPFGDAFAAAEGRVLPPCNRRLELRRFGRYRPDMDLRACRVLFICASERQNLARILGELSGGGVLTVSDMDGFVDAGGMIGLVLRERSVRWEINRATLGAAGLAVSSQLLRNAVRLVGEPPGRAAE